MPRRPRAARAHYSDMSEKYPPNHQIGFDYSDMSELLPPYTHPGQAT